MLWYYVTDKMNAKSEWSSA